MGQRNGVWNYHKKLSSEVIGGQLSDKEAPVDEFPKKLVVSNTLKHICFF